MKDLIDNLIRDITKAGFMSKSEVRRRINELILEERAKIIEMVKEMEDATESDGWEYARKNSCCPGDDWADGYNEAKKDLLDILKK